jgi:uncharacterized protein (TIGR03435 family)
MSVSGGTMLSGGLSMADFARNISGLAGRMVMDTTGLDGHYEFTLRYSTRPEPGDARPGDAPSIFTALQEQLGLKLEPDRTLLRVVVIDRIERPTEN